MWNQTRFIKLLVEHNHNLLLLREYEIDASTPDELPQPAPPPAPKSQFTPGSQSWFKQLPLPKTGDVVITSDAMARSAPKPRPPRAPGQQAMRSNGVALVMPDRQCQLVIRVESNGRVLVVDVAVEANGKLRPFRAELRDPVPTATRPRPRLLSTKQRKPADIVA